MFALWLSVHAVMHQLKIACEILCNNLNGVGVFFCFSSLTSNGSLWPGYQMCIEVIYIIPYVRVLYNIIWTTCTAIPIKCIGSSWDICIIEYHVHCRIFSSTLLYLAVIVKSAYFTQSLFLISFYICMDGHLPLNCLKSYWHNTVLS